MHRAVIGLGLLLAAVGALFWALGGPPVAVSAGAVVAGLLIAVAGWWLARRRVPAEEPAAPAEPLESIHYLGQDAAVLDDFGGDPYETVRVPASEAERAVASGSYMRGDAPAMPAAERERREESATREADLDREAELNAIADGLRALKGKQLDATNVPEWKVRIEAWVESELEARSARGEPASPQAAQFMRDFGDIPTKDWRRHLLRHLRRLGYRRYQEGEW